MLFEILNKDKKKLEYTVILARKNKTPIGILGTAFNKTLERAQEDIDSFKFDIPQLILDPITKQQRKAPYYDDVKNEMMIILRCGEIQNPVEQFCFNIKSVKETSGEKFIKHVEAYSREESFNKTKLNVPTAIERLLYNPTDGDGILDLFVKDTRWGVGHIDDSLLTDNINGGTVPRYRWFDNPTGAYWLSFLRDTVQGAYNCIFQFDSFNKTINAYDRDTYGNHTTLLLSEDNFVKDFGQSNNSMSLMTKLTLSGYNALDISSVNIFGDDAVYDYDFLIQSGVLSAELVTAWNSYKVLVAQKNVTFLSLRTQLNTLESQKQVASDSLNSYNIQIKALKAIQQSFISSGDNVNLATATTNITNMQSTIDGLNAQIASLNTQIDVVQAQINQINADIVKENARDVVTGNLIFNSDLLDELADNTFCENWSSDNYTDATTLMNEGQRRLKDYSTPIVEFTTDLIDFLSVVEGQDYWGQLKLGDFVRCYSKRLNMNLDVRIVGYSHNINENQLTISFSNKDKKLDDDRSLGSAITKGVKAGAIVNAKRLEWNNIVDTKDAIDLFLNNSLDCAKQEIISMQGDSKITINENGLWVQSVSNPNNQIALLAGLIAFTNDCWLTCNTAIDNSGVYGSAICGKLILGEKLFIQDTTGQFSIVGNLLTVKDDQMRTRVKLGEYDTVNKKYGLQLFNKTGQDVVLSEDGILSQYTMVMADNVDQTHALKIKFFVPSNTISMRQVLLAFSLEKFRAYETAIIGGSSSATTTGQSSTTTTGQSSSTSSGSSSNTTSSNNGTHRHLVFSPTGIQASNPNNNLCNEYKFANTNSGGITQAAYFPALPLYESGDYTVRDIYTYGESSSHSHSNPHTHSIEHNHDFSHNHNISHTHPSTIQYGILESSVASGVNVIVNGVTRDGSAYTTDQSSIDITQWINIGQWNTVELTSLNSIGRINCSTFISAFISL